MGGICSSSFMVAMRATRGHRQCLPEFLPAVPTGLKRNSCLLKKPHARGVQGVGLSLRAALDVKTKGSTCYSIEHSAKIPASFCRVLERFG